MAEKRMFTKKVTDSDEFVALPSSAQALYLHLCMAADDDGFNNQVQLAMYKSHASADDVKVLLAKRFIIQFENGVIVIKHWRMANALRKDRHVDTTYQDEFKMLKIKENGSYTTSENEDGLPMGCQMVANGLPQNSIVEDSIDKNSIVEDNITPPVGVENTWDTSKHTNVDNLKHILNTGEYSDTQFLLDHKDLYESLKEWMKYKDNRKPKRDNHYTELDKFLNRVLRNAKEYGVENAIIAIQDTMAEGYQGIVWDYASKRAKRVDAKDIKDFV